MEVVQEVVLWLFVVFLGVAFGAGIYESRIQVPQWRATPPGEWVETGRRFWAFVTTGPLTLLTLASLAVVWPVDGSARDWWLAAIAITVAERIGTFGYFIPTMVRLQASTGGAAVQQTLANWAAANYLRHALNLAAWLCALQALRLFE